MRKLALIVALALALPAVAVAKLQGDLRMCGASGCRVLEAHRGHDAWPVLADLSHGRRLGPALPGPYYRLALVDPDTRSESLALFFVPKGAVTRVNDGTGSVAWVRLSITPRVVARAARALRPFPAPRLTQVIVGNGRLANNPNSYLRLFRIPRGKEIIPNPAGPRPQAGVREITAYAQRVKRHWIPIYLSSARDSPWTDSSSSLAVGRRLDLIMRDGEIAKIPHALAERIRRGESLR